MSRSPREAHRCWEQIVAAPLLWGTAQRSLSEVVADVTFPDTQPSAAIDITLDTLHRRQGWSAALPCRTTMGAHATP